MEIEAPPRKVSKIRTNAVIGMSGNMSDASLTGYSSFGNVKLCVCMCVWGGGALGSTKHYP